MAYWKGHQMIPRYLLAISIFAALTGATAQAQTPFDCSGFGANTVCQIPNPNTSVKMSTAANVTYAWDSFATSNKGQHNNFPSCIAGTYTIFVVKDEAGTAAAYPIKVTPNTGETIDGQPSFSISTSYALNTGTGVLFPSLCTTQGYGLDLQQNLGTHVSLFL